jgi:hypothetical protein
MQFIGELCETPNVARYQHEVVPRTPELHGKLASQPGGRSSYEGDGAPGIGHGMKLSLDVA